MHRAAPRYLKLVTFSNFWPFLLTSALILFMLFVMTLLFFYADFHSICPCSIYEPVGEVLKFIIAATHKIDVVSKY